MENEYSGILFFANTFSKIRPGNRPQMCHSHVCVCVLIADKALASNSHLIRPFLYYFRSWIDLILFWRHYYLPILLFGKIQLTFEREKKERKDMSLGNKTLMVEVVLLDSFKWFSNRENSHFLLKALKSVLFQTWYQHTLFNYLLQTIDFGCQNLLRKYL